MRTVDSSRLADLQVRFGLFSDSAKRRRISHRQIRQNFSVYFDACLIQAVNQTAIGKSIDTRSSVYARNPQLAEIALAHSAVAIGVRLGTVNCFLCGPVQSATGTPIAFSFV